MTELIWVAIIAAVPPTLAVIASHRTQVRKLNAVHDMANSRLTEALARIEVLSLTVERQRVAAEKK